MFCHSFSLALFFFSLLLYSFVFLSTHTHTMSAHNNFLRIQFRFSIFKTKVWTFVYLLFDSWFPNHSVLCVCRLWDLALLIAVILPVFALSHESANKRILCAVIFAHGQSHSVCLLYSSKCFIVIARGVHTIFFLLSAASSLSCILVHFCHFVCSPVLRRWALFFPLLLLLIVVTFLIRFIRYK